MDHIDFKILKTYTRWCPIYNSSKFIYKLTLVSKKQHITTISDFIASRYGKRQTVALVVTLIALLATIPYIATRGEVIRGRLKTLAGVAAVAAAVPAALYVVHYQIIPIDLLFTNVMERFGLDGLIASLG